MADTWRHYVHPEGTLMSLAELQCGASVPHLLNSGLDSLCSYQVCTHCLGLAACAPLPGQKQGRSRTVRNSPPVTQSGKGQLWTHSSLWRCPRRISPCPSVLEPPKGWARPSTVMANQDSTGTRDRLFQLPRLQPSPPDMSTPGAGLRPLGAPSTSTAQWP